MDNNFTKPTTTAEIKREWVLIDVNGENLGRTASKIAELLMGKSKPYFARNMDCGDYVVVTNASLVKATGNKEEKKVYTRYSGYPGGLRRETLGEMRARKPQDVIIHAVSGMLPKNKLREKMLTRLYVFGGSEHPYGEKFTHSTSSGQES